MNGNKNILTRNTYENKMPVNFKSLLCYLPSLKLHHVVVPKEIVQQFAPDTRVMCSINDNKAFHGGLVNLGEGHAYITVNKKRMKAYAISLDDEVKVTLEKDESEFGMEVPEELEALLAQDEAGKKRFSALKPSIQRYIIYHVDGVKNSQLRIDRAIKLIENLKALPEGKENFKQILGK